jgi:hypothetical protein
MKRRDIEVHSTRILAGVLTTVSLVATGLSLGTGVSQAIPSQPHEWCPGMPMKSPPGPGEIYVWDMNVCHTWQRVNSGMGNVPRKDIQIDPSTGRFINVGNKLEGSDLWDGPNIPPGAAKDCVANDLFTGLPLGC